jgi:protein subunit release factor B
MLRIFDFCRNRSIIRSLQGKCIGVIPLSADNASLSGTRAATLFNFSTNSTVVASFSTDSNGQDHPPSAKRVHLQMDKIIFSFARSSGPGGQNVNKLNTKAELRFNVDEAADVWIPSHVVRRLKDQQMNRINGNGELLITAQEHRTQHKNKELCIDKLRDILAEAYIEPKDRKMWQGLSKKTKSNRKDEKRHRSDIKANRRSNKKDYD